MRTKLYHLLSSFAAVAAFTVAPPFANADKKADSRLEKQIEKRLLEDDRLREYTLDVEVEDSVATLKGKVALDAARAHAEKVAEMPGVKRVENQIEIDAMTLRERLQRLEQQKANNPPLDPANVPKDHIDNEGQAAPEPVQLPEPGIQLVNPEKMVGGSALFSEGGLTGKVLSQLIADEALKGSDIKVESNDQEGVVTLRGTVLSETGRTRALEIAKTTGGVQKVNDALHVGPRQ
jgi:osmotically-inducible protein OsmY